jgi:uncharacterized protein YdcH (DUF465 family)
MPTESQPLEKRLVKTDEEFRELSETHFKLERRLQDLLDRSYLSEPEQVEEMTLKKRKLQLKDRMENILRRERGMASAHAATKSSGPVVSA